jgi:histidinol-phosphatase
MQEISFAIEVCQAAGEIAMKHYRQGVECSDKSDGSPVTIADRECEQFIRDRINQTFAADGILGEEHGESIGSVGNRRWIIDPIDGTFNYARQITIFSTLLALEADGEIVLGVVHAPAMAETFWAEKGKGAFRNGEKISVSQCSKIAEANFNFGSPERILKAGYWQGFTSLVECTRRQRGFGDYLSFSQVFEGKAEAAVEMNVKPWDLAPMKILAEESGGKYSDLKGSNSIYTGSCLVSNSFLHEQFVDIIRSRVTAAPRSE